MVNIEQTGHKAAKMIEDNVKNAAENNGGLILKVQNMNKLIP